MASIDIQPMATALGAEISGVIAGLSQRLEHLGADALVAACTEVPLVLDASAATLPLISATDLLVAHTIELAREGRKED